MELFEISDRIDTRLKSFEAGISVDEYEKSLYLSKVQKDIYYEYLKAFEDTQVISYDLKPFVVDYITSTQATPPVSAIQGSQVFQMPDNVAKIIYESAVIANRFTRVIPIRISDANYKMESPFRTPNRDETLRVIREGDVAELLAYDTVDEYRVKYFEEIEPIILEDLPDDLTIDGIKIANNTKFNDDILNKIIDITVKLILGDASVFAKQQ